MTKTARAFSASHGRRNAVAGLLALLVQVSPLLAQDGSGAVDSGGGFSGPGSVQLPSSAETLVVDSVVINTRGSSGDAAGDAAILDRVRTSVGLREGDRLSSVGLDVLGARLSDLPGVIEAQTSLAAAGGGGRARVVVDVELGPETAVHPGATGVLAGDGAGALPMLWRRDGQALRFILNTGIGAFSDGNPWFGSPETFTLGNPLVQDPSLGANTGSRATWAEAWVEFGIGGVTQLGATNSAVYGAVTAIAPAATGQDIFRNDFRSSIDVEKAYVGYVWSDPDARRSFDLSFGRLNYTLNDGFLISQFGSQWNAGPRPGVYLAPRTTMDFGAVAKAKLDAWSATAFYLDPNEYEPLESNTKLAGLNVRYAFSEPFYVDASVIRAVESDTLYRAPSGTIGARNGLTTIAAHVRWADRDRLPGVWVEAEGAHQTHDAFDMDAYAGYAVIGYLARDLPWTPSLSLRSSIFSGDDPATATYERFDSLYSGGLSEWLQGISLGKALTPSNRVSQRIRLNVTPNPRLNLTLDVFWHRADQFNNIGGNPALAQLSSKDLGEEVQFTARWAIRDDLYFLGVVGRAFPGQAIKDATGGTAEDWTTVQAQLFRSF